MGLLIIFIELLVGAFLLGEINQSEAKLDKEDEILHELTACEQ